MKKSFLSALLLMFVVPVSLFLVGCGGVAESNDMPIRSEPSTEAIIIIVLTFLILLLLISVPIVLFSLGKMKKGLLSALVLAFIVPLSIFLVAHEVSYRFLYDSPSGQPILAIVLLIAVPLILFILISIPIVLFILGRRNNRKIKEMEGKLVKEKKK